MKKLADLRGLRFPDAYVVRMFFKEKLDKTPGRVLELGCGSGNNLLLFDGFGWDVTGVDIDEASLLQAAHNLDIGEEEASGKLLQHDLSSGLPMLQGPFDVLLAPSSLYYIPRAAARVCLSGARGLLRSGAMVFLRMRLPDDHRAGRGRPLGRDTWILECQHTGEMGATNVFWQEHELVELLHSTLGIEAESLTLLRVAYENVQNGWLVRNSDIVIWGRIP